MFIDKTGLIDNGGSIAYADAIKKAYKEGTAVLASQILDGPDTKMVLQPNPSNNQFEIQFMGVDTKAGSVEVVDMQGKVVFSSLLGENKLTVPSTDWTQGIYLVRLTENGRVYQKKFIKN
jgi:hypothetical protein